MKVENVCIEEKIPLNDAEEFQSAILENYAVVGK